MECIPPLTPREPSCGWAADAVPLTLGLIDVFRLCALVLPGQRFSTILQEGCRRLHDIMRRLASRFKGGRRDSEEGGHLRDASRWVSVRGEHRIQSTSKQGPGGNPGLCPAGKLGWWWLHFSSCRLLPIPDGGHHKAEGTRLWITENRPVCHFG